MDTGSASVPATDYSAGIGKSLAGLRIGVVRHFFEKDLLTDPETIAALETSVVALRDLGAVVGDVTLSPFGSYADCGSLISRSESYAIHQHWLRDDAGVVWRVCASPADGGGVHSGRGLYQCAAGTVSSGGGTGRGHENG